MSRKSPSRTSVDSEGSARNTHQPSTAFSSLVQQIGSIYDEGSERGPGSLNPLPEPAALKKYLINVYNVTVDPSVPSSQRRSLKVPIEDVRLLRRAGEGKIPIFRFLLPVTFLEQKVIFQGDPSELKAGSALKPVDLKSLPQTSYPVQHRSRSNDRERERDRYCDQGGERGRDRNDDKSRGDVIQHHLRRNERDHVRSRHDLDSIRSYERESEKDRQLVRDRSDRGRTRERDRDFARGSDRDRSRDRNGERSRDRDGNRFREREEARHYRERGQDRNSRSESDSHVKTELVKTEIASPESNAEGRRPRDSESSQSYTYPPAPYMNGIPRMTAPHFRPHFRPVPPPFMPPLYAPFPMPRPPMFFPRMQHPSRFHAPTLGKMVGGKVAQLETTKNMQISKI